MNCQPCCPNAQETILGERAGTKKSISTQSYFAFARLVLQALITVGMRRTLSTIRPRSGKLLMRRSGAVVVSDTGLRCTRTICSMQMLIKSLISSGRKLVPVFRMLGRELFWHLWKCRISLALRGLVWSMMITMNNLIVGHKVCQTEDILTCLTLDFVYLLHSRPGSFSNPLRIPHSIDFQKGLFNSSIIMPEHIIR